ncbi:MAG TPA: phosphoadenylyl-sulfate reductase [Rhizobiales bacterium]|nr:phosphoadenylyl-sulfate reductase [Hyphomicrobiales bacterium]
MLAKSGQLEAGLRPFHEEEAVAAEAAALESRYGGLEPQDVITFSIGRFGHEELAAVSSFGADSAVLLHMLARIDPALPVIFLDTGKHFEETLRYRDALAADFGLRNVKVYEPLPSALVMGDPSGDLHRSNADACCNIRKVEPMARAVEPLSAWFTGRKRFQASTRTALPVFEATGPRIRINPLARWTAADLAAYMRAHQLRENPLVAYGYLSIGCFPCTQPVKPGEDARSGRWAGQAKTECGIHLSDLDHSLTASSL